MALKGDFIGFTFNGIHSSIMGIVRTSNGSRYNHNLLPNSLDQTVAVPGGDGAYFFGSNYTTRVFLLLIASDELTEARMSAIKLWLGDKLLHELIFDEAPYKVYMAKCTNIPQFNFICFGEKGERIYKGEGSIEFTCYYPYARSRYKFLNEYTWGNIDEWKGDEAIINNKLIHNHVLLGNLHIATPHVVNGYDNKAEWADASGMFEDEHGDFEYVTWPSGYSKNITPDTVRHDFDEMKSFLYLYNDVTGEYDLLPSDADFDTYFEIVTEEGVKKIKPINGTVYYERLLDTPLWTRGGNAYSIMRVYNPGDVPADYLILFETHNVNRIYFYKQLIINNVSTSVILYKINFDFTGSDIPDHMLMDSKTELLTGYNYDDNNEVYVPDNKIYNRCIKSGDFFKIPLSIPIECYNMRFILGVIPDTTYEAQFKQITYNYLYY